MCYAAICASASPGSHVLQLSRQLVSMKPGLAVHSPCAAHAAQRVSPSMQSPLHRTAGLLFSLMWTVSVMTWAPVHLAALLAMSAARQYNRKPPARHTRTTAKCRRVPPSALVACVSMQRQPQHAHHFAFEASTLPPKVDTWIHLVALHFSPFVVGQEPCSEL